MFAVLAQEYAHKGAYQNKYDDHFEGLSQYPQ